MTNFRGRPWAGGLQCLAFCACGALAGLLPSHTEAAAVPTSLQGPWTPLSRSLETAGELTLTATSLRWSPCGEQSVAVSAIARSPNAERALIRIAPEAACRLDEVPITRLQLVRPPGGCEVTVTVFSRPEDVAPRRLMAQGTFSLQGCAKPRP